MNVDTEKNLKKIGFFSSNKFTVGLFSVFYTSVIAFFILLALILPLRKFGKIRPGDFFFIGIPAWILIIILLIIAGESGKWWLYPHWLWTSFKKAVVDIQKREVYFTTGFPPFFSRKKYPFDFIDSLILTSRSQGDLGSKELFGLKVKLRNNEQWKFFDMFKNEREFRRKTRELSLLLDCPLSDLTYAPSTGEKFKSASVKSKEKEYIDRRANDSAALGKPKGIEEKEQEDGCYLFFVSRRNEWPSFILLTGIWVGIYLLTWGAGWTSPSAPGSWEGMWLLIAAILTFIFLKSATLLKTIKLKDDRLFYRLYFLGIPISGKQVPVKAITKITRQNMELFTFRLVIVSDEQTVKINGLTRDMAVYLEKELSRRLSEYN